MKSEFQSISSLRKNFEALKPQKKVLEFEVPKASSTANLSDLKSKKYESLSYEKLLKVANQLKKENKALKKVNQKQEKQIKELEDEVNKLKYRIDDSSSRPISCMRTSNSVPKKNRVMFSKELVHVLNENPKKSKKIVKVQPKNDPAYIYNYNLKKVTRKIQRDESKSPEKKTEESEYYTPLSCSLQDKKIFSQTVAKHFDLSPKFKEKQKLFKKAI